MAEKKRVWRIGGFRTSKLQGRDGSGGEGGNCGFLLISSLPLCPRSGQQGHAVEGEGDTDLHCDCSWQPLLDRYPFRGLSE